jgi:soluble lytic murein transglycosylase-like protein
LKKTAIITLVATAAIALTVVGCTMKVASDSYPQTSPVPSPSVVEVPHKPEIKDVPLPAEVTDYLWKKSMESNFSYELLLAIAKQESVFNVSLISRSGDYGLMQLQPRTARWIAEQLQVPNYNLLDYKTNIDFAVYYLSYLRQYWDTKGLSGITLTDRVILSYNKGIQGASSYVSYHKANSSYVYNIENYKKQFENR